MASNINPTQPETGNASTAAVRANFLAAKNEIEALQDAVAALQPSLLQQVVSQVTAVWTTNTSLPGDDSVPQNTEGGQLFAVDFTPIRADSIIDIEVIARCSASTTSAVTLALFEGNAANATIANSASCGADSNVIVPLHAVLTAGTADQRSYKVRAGQSAGGTMTVNGWGGNRTLGGVAPAQIIIREYLAP